MTKAAFPIVLATLLLAGCHSPAKADMDSDDVDVAAIERHAAANASAAKEIQPEQVAIAPLPAPEPSGAAAEILPLTKATETEQAIARGIGITRVPHGDGWAWLQDGKIIRTASRDGKHASYFRPGENAPYLVQDGERTFAYANGRVVRAFGTDGRPEASDADHLRNAEQIARNAAENRHPTSEAPPPQDHSTLP